jgi:beta-lactamase regulating signal transducer with metallopeptidase domain
MGQSRKAARQQAMAQRQHRRWQRTKLLIAAPVVIVAVAAAVTLTRQPGYSGFDVIGKQSAVVQVFLPG